MSKIVETQEKVTKLLADAHQILHADSGVTVEGRESVNKMFAEVEVLENDLANMRRLEKFQADQRSFVPVPRPGTAEAKMSVEERKAKWTEAFRSYAKDGKYGMSQEHRDLLTTSAATGGALIPQDFLPTLIEAQKYYGPIAQRVQQKITNNNGAQIKIALTNDTGNGLRLVGEGTAVPEIDPSFSNKLLSVDTVSAGLVKVSLQEMDDSYFDLDSWIRTAFGVRYGRGLEAAITKGTDGAATALPNVVSLISAGVTGATTAAPTAISYDDLVNVYAALDEAYRSRSIWSMSAATRNSLLGVTDTLGRPLFNMDPSTSQFNKLLSNDIVINQSMAPVAATNVAVQYGSFEDGYLLRTDGMPSIKRLDERFADTLEVGFLMFTRIGGTSLDAGTHPIVNLVQHA